MKYSSARVGATSSMRKGTTGMPLFTARSTSRSICEEALALPEKTSTIKRALPIASMIDSAQPTPGRMSRGAIHTRTRALKRMAHRVRGILILGRVGEEYVVRHGQAPRQKLPTPE
jgi:hypothetical protein